MKNKIKGLLALVLSVLIGQVWAADPVAIWTDFSSLTSGNYTITTDDACKLNEDGSITLGGAGLSLPVSGDAITVVMDVSNVPATDGITVASVQMNGSYVSLKSTGTQLIQSWNNGGNYGTFDWTPAKRQTIVLGTMQSNPSGTTTWIDGEQKVAHDSLMTTNGDLQNVYIGSYSGTGTDGTVTGSAAGMTIHSLRIYSTKLSTEAVVADYKIGNVDWVVSFDNNNTTIGWVNSWGGEANASYVSTPNGQGYLIKEGFHPYYDYKLTKPSSIALYADISSVSKFTGNGAALIAFGKPGSSVIEENSGNLVLSKVADGTVSVSRNGTQLVSIENADLAVAGSYHLFVFGINADGKVFLSVDNEKKESEGSTMLPASGLQIGSMFTAIGSYVRAYNMVVDEVRGYEKYLSDADLASLREAFPAYSPDLVIVDANKNYSDLQIAESSNTTIIVNEGCTLTMNGEVTCNSLVIQGPGVVALDSEVGDPFKGVDRLAFDGVTLQGGATDYIDVSSLISLTSGKTLKTKGFLDFTNENNAIASGATLEVVSGVTKFFAAEQGIKGTLTIDSDATFVNTRPGDALAYDTNGVVVNIYGTLDMGATRWTIFANKNTINAYAGATITGVGQSGNGALDVWEKAGQNNDNVAFNIYKNGENASDVTIFSTIRYREEETVFNIAQGMTVNLAGTNANINTIHGGLKVKGSGVLKLSDKNAYADTYGAGIKIDSGATLIVNHVEALGSQNIVNNGTLELDVEDASVTFAKVISGTGAVNVKSGTWKLTALNTIDGNVTIESGATLNIADQNARLFKGTHCTKTLTIKGTLITRNWIWGESNALGCLAHNDGRTVINGGKVVFVESFESPRIVQIGNDGATFEIKEGETFAATAGDGNNAITGTGNLKIVSGTMKLQKSFASSGSMTIDKGAKVEVETGTLSAFVENLEESAGVNVNGTIEFLSSGMLYRSFAGNGVVAVKGDVAINNTGNNGKLTGLSRFKGSVIVDEGKTLTLTFWNNGYDIELSELEVNGSVTGNKGNGYATTLNLTTTKLSGSGTISGVDTFTLADGATLAGAVTVTGNVTVEGAVNVTHATQAGDTVITCANAESLNLTKFAAPAGYKCIADGTTIKLAVATVNVTIPVAPTNTKWYDADGNVVEAGTIAVEPNTNVTLTLKANEGYVFADGSTEKEVTVNAGAEGAEITTPDVTAATPVAQVGETKYQALQAAVNAANAGATVTVIADIVTDGPITVNKKVTVNLGGKTIAATNDTEGNGVFYVVAGGDLTLEGEGTVNALGLNDWCMAVWAKDGGKVTINGGTYTNVGATSEEDGAHFDLIYVRNGGSVEINGGTFICQTPRWTLNSRNDEPGTFVVKGGKFYDFNPANVNTDDNVTTWCADGYTATEGEDGYWTVALIPVSNNVAKIGETEYETLEAAFTAAKEMTDSVTVTLLKDIGSETTPVVVAIPECKSEITFDMGGFKVVGGIDTYYSAKVTIKNGTIESYNSDYPIHAKKGHIVLRDINMWAKTAHGLRLEGSSSSRIKCEIYGGTYNSGNYTLYAKSHADMIVYSGTVFKGSNSGGNALNLQDGTTVTVNGGTFSGTIQANGTTSILTINGGFFKNTITNGSGTENIFGGYFVAKQDSSVTTTGYTFVRTDEYADYPWTSVKADYALTVNAENAEVSELNATYQYEDVVSFTVAPAAGYKVTSVKLGTDELTADANGNYTFTMPAKAVAITVTVEAESTFDVTIGGTSYADADALKLAANSTTTMTVPEGKWMAEGNVLKKDGAAYVEFADYYTVVVNGTTVTLKLNKPVIGDSAEGADDAFTVTAEEVTIKITNFNSALKYGVRIAADINSLKTAEITEVETEDGVITLTKSGDSAFYEVVVSDVDFPTTSAE